jgi:hypothetical protein
VFQASSAARILWIAVSSVNGRNGGRASDISTSSAAGPELSAQPRPLWFGVTCQDAG